MRNLILLLFTVFILSCQKDYYLEDLLDAESTIKSLTSQLSNKDTQISQLRSEIASLNSELDTADMTIEELEIQLAILKGPQDGLYTSYQGKSNLSDESWNSEELFHFYEVENKSFKNKGSLYDGTANGGIKYIRWDNNHEKRFLDSVQLQVIGVDELNIKIFFKGTRWGLEEQVIFDYKARKVHDNYNEAHNLTSSQIKDIYIEKGVGIYSDPIYSTIDWEDIHDFVRVFKEDAKRHGIDKSYIGSEYYYVEVLPSEIVQAVARGGGTCEGHGMQVQYSEWHWDGYPDDPYRPSTLATMYHELGHATMAYPHPAYEGEYTLSRYKVMPGYDGVGDIMGYGETPWRGGETLKYYLTISDDERLEITYKTIDWTEAVDRFFAGTSHDVYSWCSGSGKSRPSIVSCTR